jgi:hypothetical protein
MEIEFRFVFDCESMEKALQYRTVIDPWNATNWKTVPTVLGVINDDGEVIVNGNEE